MSNFLVLFSKKLLSNPGESLIRGPIGFAVLVFVVPGNVGLYVSLLKAAIIKLLNNSMILSK
jgi:hypothetical protein